VEITVPGICWGRAGKVFEKFSESFLELFLVRKKFLENNSVRARGIIFGEGAGY